MDGKGSGADAGLNATAGKRPFDGAHHVGGRSAEFTGSAGGGAAVVEGKKLAAGARLAVLAGTQARQRKISCAVQAGSASRTAAPLLPLSCGI